MGLSPPLNAPTLTVRVTGLDGDAAALAVPLESEPGSAPIRVYGGVPGDHAVVTVLSRGRNATWTDLLHVLGTSPDRVPAPCPHARTCGGCPWQAVSRPAQLRAKAARLRALMDGSPNLRMLADQPFRSSPRILGFRTKLQMPIGGAPGALTAGFYGPHSKSLVVVDDCVVQHPLGERVRRAVLNHLNQHRVAPWHDEDGTGELRTLLLRVSEYEEHVALVLVVGDASRRDWVALGQELIAEIPGLVSVGQNLNAARQNVVLGPITTPLAGRVLLTERILGVDIDVDTASFFQTSAVGATLLAEAVRDACPPAFPRFLEVYSGTGLFARTLADRYEHATLIERSDGGARAAVARFPTARVVQGDADAALRALAHDDTPSAPDLILLDPPRGGLGPTADAVAALSPPRVVLVSCSPDAFVRDVDRLASHGYAAVRVEGVDLFPHTPHFEVVTLLQKAQL
ncbi:MAG: 23S rRNA (uracil(1939)-C(5))-methyltransferase RlmD [Myxococcales bacterium]|nr:23S rRNA (uracil(1939)-C(5))-methyltransferase RlmD [Myxococcales bacterium]